MNSYLVCFFMIILYNVSTQTKWTGQSAVIGTGNNYQWATSAFNVQSEDTPYCVGGFVLTHSSGFFAQFLDKALNTP